MAKVQKKYKTVPVFQRLRPANSPAGPRRLRGPVPHGARSNKKAVFYQPDVSNIINSISEQTAAKKKIGGFLGRSAKRIIIFIYNNKNRLQLFPPEKHLEKFHKKLVFQHIIFYLCKTITTVPVTAAPCSPVLFGGCTGFSTQHQTDHIPNRTNR